MIASTRKPSLLYLVHRFPYPPDKGDRIRTFHIIRFLAARCRLSVGTLADEPVPAEHLSALARHCDRLYVAPLQSPTRWLRAGWSLLRGGTVTAGAFASAELRSVVADWARPHPFDAVLVSSSSMLPYLTMPELCDVPAVADLIDVDSEKWRQYAESSRGPKRLLYRLEGARLGCLEANLSGSVRAVTLVSEAEADLYRRLARVQGAQPVGCHSVSNGVDLDYFRPADHSPPAAPDPLSIAFLGAMDYRPNVDAVVWFCRHVWPGVRERFPECRFEIVGRRPTEEVQRLASLPGVVATGAVPDVRPHLARAALTVAPLQIARGVQNKILEAMAMARPVIASPQALEGLSVRPGEDVLSAAAPDAWVQAINGLLQHPERRAQLGRSARRYVEQHHDWETRLAPLMDLLEIGAPSQRSVPEACRAAS